MLTQAIVKKHLSYNPKTGVLTRKSTGEAQLKRAKEGYLRVKIQGKQYPTHRVVWLYTYGEFPENTIDHINGVKTDNRIENLRDVTSTENNRNRSLSSNNKSGISGVYWCKRYNRWVARIGSKSGKENLGNFKNLFEACCARKSAEIRLGYHFNHGRLISEQELKS